jgi:hypothetical protein
MIKASAFKDGQTNLIIGGYKTLVEPRIDAYVALMTVSFKNFCMLMGKYYAEEVSKEHPLTDKQLNDLKLASEYLNDTMQIFLSEIYKRLP